MYICIYVNISIFNLKLISLTIEDNVQCTVSTLSPTMSHLAAMSCPAKFTDLATAGIHLPAHNGTIKIHLDMETIWACRKLGYTMIYPPVMAV